MISDIPRNFSGADDGIDDTEVQKELLMDLAGADSLIGRAMFVSEIDTARMTKRDQVPVYEITDPDTVVLGCCVIARAAGPEATPAPADQVW